MTGLLIYDYVSTNESAPNVYVCVAGDCPAGQYADGVTCIECPDGTYNTAARQVGADACVQCTCADLGSAAGTDCVDRELTTGGTGATARSQCRSTCFIMLINDRIYGPIR